MKNQCINYKLIMFSSSAASLLTILCWIWHLFFNKISASFFRLSHECTKWEITTIYQFPTLTIILSSSVYANPNANCSYLCLGAQGAPGIVSVAAPASGTGTVVGTTIGSALGTVLIMALIAMAVRAMKKGRHSTPTTNGVSNTAFQGKQNATMRASNNAFDEISLATTSGDTDSLSSITLSEIM